MESYPESYPSQFGRTVCQRDLITRRNRPYFITPELRPDDALHGPVVHAGALANLSVSETTAGEGDTLAVALPTLVLFCPRPNAVSHAGTHSG